MISQSRSAWQTKRTGRVPKSGFLQADRIVLDLQDSPLSATDVTAVLGRKPIKGLREVIVIEGGIPTWLFP